MKRLLLPLFLPVFAATAVAQGSLTPPGPPAPTQKSLQEIWNKVGGLETQLSLTQGDLAQLRAENRLLGAVLAGSNVQFAWSITAVDGAQNVGSYNCIAFGPDGQPTISYYDATGQNLKCARFNGTAWTIATVDSLGSVGSHTSMTFGPDGQPAISYFDATSSNLKFARFNGVTWTVTTVDSAGIVGEFTSLAFGPDGQPAISYFDATNVGKLKIARYNGSVWASAVVDSGGLGKYTSLAFGPDGYPMISYWYSSGALKSARFNGISWVVTNVMSGYVGEFSSIAFGPDGQPAISHRNWSGDASLHFSRYSDSFWTSSKIATIDYGGFGESGATSLAFGPDGQPAVAYNVGLINTLNYATFNGSAWVSNTVASSTGSYNSLSFGPDGQPAISYHDSGGLKFARKGIFKPVP